MEEHKEQFENNQKLDLNFKDYSEISIMGDGNCFFLCLSQHFENHQEIHPYYRHLIYQYILQIKEILKHFFYKEANETTEKYENRYNTFIEQIDTDCNYAGDFEISAASITLHIGIYILKKL